MSNLVSRAYMEGDGPGTIHIKRSWLDHGTEGVIALTGAAAGPVDMAFREGHAALAEARLKALANYFPAGSMSNCSAMPAMTAVMKTACWKLAYRLELPIVATNEPFFPAADDFEAHDALMAVAHGALVSDDSRFRLTRDLYFKSRAEMAKLFADLPEAIENTVEIARRCAFMLKGVAPILPRFTGASDDHAAAEKAESDELARQAGKGCACGSTRSASPTATPRRITTRGSNSNCRSSPR